jgi:hypothetical protein
MTEQYGIMLVLLLVLKDLLDSPEVEDLREAQVSPEAEDLLEVLDLLEVHLP